MSLNNVQETVCSMMKSRAALSIDTLEQTVLQHDSLIVGLNTDLGGLSAPLTPPTIPPTPDVRQAISIFEACIGINPLDLIKGLLKFDFLPTGDLGFDLSARLGGLGSIVNGLGFIASLPILNGLLNCLSAICGVDVSSQLARKNSAMQTLGMDNTGKFDASIITTNAGVSSHNTTVLHSSTDSLISIKESVVSQAKDLF